MSTLFSAVVIFLVVFAATAKTNTKIPKWVDNPFEYCSKTELCAVGEGAGAMTAEANARVSLAKVFKTEVKGKTKVFTSGSSTQAEDVLQGESQEDYSRQIEEATSEVLKGVTIKEKYTSDESIFALASLNKAKAARGLKTEIFNLDDMIKHHYKDGSRSSLSKALKSAFVRQDLHWKYQFLTDQKLTPPVSIDQILTKKNDKKKQGTVVLVKVKEIGKIDEFKHLVIAELIDQDFRVVTDKNKTYDYIVTANLAQTKEHMKVDGWEKYRFSLQFQSSNKEGAKIGALEFTTSKAGRNLTNALENALPEIRQFVSDKLDELNID